MRYYENSEFWDGQGPILIMIGGEWAISTGFLEAGLMYEIASAHHAMMYYTEHRYYGSSKPTSDTSSENLQYLNVDQALADLAYFIQKRKDEEKIKNLPVYVFGGSYAGSIAVWSRLKYPHLIQGAHASSAPIYAKADFYEYYEVVTRSLIRYSEQCAADVKSAFMEVERLISKRDGPDQLKTYFNMCSILETNNPSSVSYFMSNLADKFADAVQYDAVDQSGKTKIEKLCKSMMDSSLGTPLQRLANLFKSTNCLNDTYETFTDDMKKTTWDAAEKNNMRLWYHQTCTEYGYYSTTNSSKSVFGTLFPLNFFTNLCIDLYGKSYNSQFLDSRVKRTNIMYGGPLPQVTNVIFTNGDIDPWHALSVLEDLNESSPAIFINGSSHCKDLYPNSYGDVADLRNARVKVRKMFDQWITS
ncbi:putative serine protease K12H4.7 isoform X2 [Prorops nasuta]